MWGKLPQSHFCFLSRSLSLDIPLSLPSAPLRSPVPLSLLAQWRNRELGWSPETAFLLFLSTRSNRSKSPQTPAPQRGKILKERSASTFATYKPPVHEKPLTGARNVDLPTPIDRLIVAHRALKRDLHPCARVHTPKRGLSRAPVLKKPGIVQTDNNPWTVQLHMTSVCYRRRRIVEKCVSTDDRQYSLAKDSYRPCFESA